jgi:hypothetical protein
MATPMNLFDSALGSLGQRDCDGFTPFIISAQTDNAPIMEWGAMAAVDDVFDGGSHGDFKDGYPLVI